MDTWKNAGGTQDGPVVVHCLGTQLEGKVPKSRSCFLCWIWSATAEQECFCLGEVGGTRVLAMQNVFLLHGSTGGLVEERWWGAVALGSLVSETQRKRHYFIHRAVLSTSSLLILVSFSFREWILCIFLGRPHTWIRSLKHFEIGLLGYTKHSDIQRVCAYEIWLCVGVAASEKLCNC